MWPNRFPSERAARPKKPSNSEHTLTSHHPNLPPVYSTPDMIRLMETAAFHALQPYCEGDEITVGTSINIEHRAASGIGAHIKAEAVLESFDGRFYTLRVTARDDVAGNRTRHRRPGRGQRWKVRREDEGEVTSKADLRL